MRSVLLAILLLPSVAAGSALVPDLVDPARDVVLYAELLTVNAPTPEVDLTAVWTEVLADGSWATTFRVVDLAHRTDPDEGLVFDANFRDGDVWVDISAWMAPDWQAFLCAFPDEGDPRCWAADVVAADALRVVVPAAVPVVPRAPEHASSMVLRNEGGGSWSGGGRVVSARDWAPEIEGARTVPWGDNPMGWYAPPESAV